MKRLFPLALALSACAVPMEAPAPGVPDPAGLACLKQGSRLEMKGATRYCQLPGGPLIEAEAILHDADR